jgi:hypothetical protein
MQALIYERKGDVTMTDKELPEYEPPEVTTYTDAEILEEMEPVQAISPWPPDP